MVMETNRMPVIIMSVVVSLILLTVGVFAVLTVTETEQIKSTYDRDFTVTDPYNNQFFDTEYQGLKGMTVTQTLSNDTTLAIASADYTYTVNNLIVNKTILYTKLTEYTNVGDDANMSYYGVDRMAQTFTVGTNGSNVAWDIDYIKIKMYRFSSSPFGGNPGPVYFNITAVNNTAFKWPTGATLSTGSKIINGSTGVTKDSAGAWYRINMSSYSLQPGTTYALIVQSTNSTYGNSTNWTTTSSGAYSGGKALYYNNAGTTWVNQTTDTMFEVYAQNDTATITVTALRNIPDVTGISNQMFNILGVVLVIGAIMLIVVLIKKAEIF